MDDPNLVELALRIASRTASGLGLPQLFGEVTREIGATLGLRGAVVVVPEAGCIAGSDRIAELVGELQHREGQGPLPTAVRLSRPMVVPDLRRVGPPSLAALAADAGLVSSAAAALRADGRAVGGLQLLGTVDHPVTARHLVALAPVLDVLGARVRDVLDLQEVRTALAAAREAGTGGSPVHLPAFPARSTAPDVPPVATRPGHDRPGDGPIPRHRRSDAP